MLWKWDPERVYQLVRAVIRTGHTPDDWKIARGVCIPKPGKSDYSKAKAYRVISLLSTMSKLVEKVVANKLSELAEQEQWFHRGQFGGRRHRSAVEAASVLVRHVTNAWEKDKVAGAIMLDIKGAFPTVNRDCLASKLRKMGLHEVYVRWVENFMTDRTMSIAMDGEEGEPIPVDTGLPQGSPVSPVLFLLYIADLGKEVETENPDTVGLSFVDDITWIETGKTAKEVARKLQKRACETLRWADSNAVQIEADKTEAVFFSRKRNQILKAREISVQVGPQSVKFNHEATRWLGVYLDSHLTFKRHREIWTTKARAAQRRLQRICGPAGVTPGAAAKIQTACIQSIALYGVEAWTSTDEYGPSAIQPMQRIINEQARRATGMLKSTPEGALMAASGMTPAEAVINKRRRRFRARLACRPLTQNRQCYPKPWNDMTDDIKERIIAGEHTHIERIRSDIQNTKTLGNLIIHQRETALEEAEECAQLADLAYFTDGSRLEDGRAGAAVVEVTNGKVEYNRRYRRPLGRGKEEYDAELVAILTAHIMARRRLDEDKLPREINIIADSQGALRRLQFLGDGPGQTIVQAIHQHEQFLAAKTDGQVVVNYRWVPAHEGMWANEMADEDARAAAELPHILNHDHYLSLSNISRQVSESIAELRKRFIRQRGGRKFQWSGKLRMNPALKNATKREAGVFWQMSCGHALTGDYLANKIRKTESDTCWHCNTGKQMSRSHLIERCPAFKEERKQLRSDIQRAFQAEARRKKKPRWKGRAPVREMFAKECLTEAVMDFLRATKIGRTGRPPEEDGQADN